MNWLDAIRWEVLTLPDLAKFGVVIAAIVSVARLAARIGVPLMIGLLLFGVLGRPRNRYSSVPQGATRAIIFGATTIVPLLFGTFLGLGWLCTDSGNRRQLCARSQ